MARTSWQVLEDLFWKALILPPHRRTAFLDRACFGNSAFRSEIEALLACADRSADFLEVPAFDLLAKRAETGPAIAQADLPLPAGACVGPYRIDNFIGGGGMGRVYAARDLRLERDVALKFLPSRLAGDPAALARFQREARAASALNHPNICTLHDIGEHEGRPFLVMELLEGKSLKDLLAESPLPPHQIISIVIQIASALEAAHGKGIVHRDIKPANLFLTTSGQAKILDFGLAKYLSEPLPDRPAGPALGTAAYVAPEQALGHPVDARADLYSLGITLYQLATGALPFNRRNPLLTLEAEVAGAPLPPRARNKRLPRRLERIILKAIAADASLRYQNAAQLRSDLERLRPGRIASRWTWAACAAAILITAALMLRWRASQSLTPALVPVPLTTEAGRERHPALSPDGSRLAYACDRNGNFDIFVGRLTPSEPVQLTAHPSQDVSPSWSPDGRSIAFVRFHPGGPASILVIPISGGAEREVTRVEFPPDPDPIAGPYLAWMPDGQALVFSERPAAGRPLQLSEISVVSGRRRFITQPPPGSLGDVGPAVSPDGRRLSFLRLADVAVSDIWVMDCPTPLHAPSNPSRLTAHNRWTTSVAWLPDGKSLVYSSGDIRTRRALWIASISGQPSRQLPAPAEDCYGVTSCRGSRRIVFTFEPSDLDIWCLGLRTASTSQPRKLIASTRREYQAHYSPLGNRIAFQSNRSGSWEIWTAGADGGRPTQLTSFGGPMTGTPRWSPDGASIAFDSRPDGQGEIFVISAAGGAPRKLTDNPAEDIVPSWSSDGKLIYFTSRRSGAFEVWRVPAAGGIPIQLTRNGGFGPRESPDGKSFYYCRSREDPTLWRMPSTGGPEVRVAGPLQNWSTFTPSSEGVLAALKDNQTVKLRSFPSGRLLYTFTAPLHYGFSLSPDEEFLIFTQIDSEEADLLTLDLPRLD